MWYVYVIKSVDKDFTYIGSTNNLKRRFQEHNEGSSQSTRPYRPSMLLSYIAVQTEEQARKLEQYFKTGSGKAILYKRILQRNNGTESDKALA
jgi:putative endonuclease